MARTTIPPVAFRFEVRFIDVERRDTDSSTEEFVAYFQQVSGIGGSMEVKTRRRGARNNRRPIELPKGVKFPDLVLKRGLLFEKKGSGKGIDLLGWIMKTFQNGGNNLMKKDVIVTLANESGNPLIAFKYKKAWVKQWQLGDFNAMESSLAIETITLAFQSMEIDRNPPPPPNRR
ncbi:MAG: phage tail protein [Bacteroidia bacterium]|nr:phage tail protein [Bacteroidia bacterium]